MRRLRAGCASQTAHWGCYMNEYLGPWPNLTARRLEVCEDCYLPVSVYTLPQRIRSRGRAPASPMGFPPPLVPHINCEPRHPLSTERWDWVVCRNALWVKQIVVCHLPIPLWEQRPQSPPSSSCPKARKMLHRASVPERDPHVIHSTAISKFR
jgi:hypothetical protein